MSQCPITAGNSFLYDFTAADQSGELRCIEQPTIFRSDRILFSTGTFWYHSHLTTQYCDGLRGPLVVYDPEDPLKQYYDIDDGMIFRCVVTHPSDDSGKIESTVITLADWYHRAAHFLPPGP